MDKESGANKIYSRDQVKPDKRFTGCEEFGTLTKLAGRQKFNCSKRLQEQFRCMTAKPETKTIRPLENSPQTRPRSSDSVVDKRTKNNLYDVKSGVHRFGGSFGSVVDKRTRA